MMFVLTLLVMTTLGCDRQEPTLDATGVAVEFATDTLRIASAADTFVLEVEVAATAQERNMGLMRRESLPEESGMIFLFDAQQPPEGVFWMYNTLIPLSIAFLDQEGVIGNIRDMEPCPSQYPQYCPNYTADVPYWAALEVNRGYFEERGIGVGDRVILEPE